MIQDLCQGVISSRKKPRLGRVKKHFTEIILEHLNYCKYLIFPQKQIKTW